MIGDKKKMILSELKKREIIIIEKCMLWHYKLFGELDCSVLVAGVLAMAGVTEHTDSSEPRRLHHFHGLLFNFHKLIIKLNNCIYWFWIARGWVNELREVEN